MSASLGDLEQLVILAILRLGDDAFGAAMQREIESRTGRRVALGALYTTLIRLQEKRLVRSTMSDPLPQRGGRRRRLYTVLPTGERALRSALRALNEMSRGLEPQLKMET